ncbi:hypothetical protein Tco_0686539 [Tanacetum coccineum]
MGIQLLHLELRLGKIPSRSFRPVKSAEILWQFWASSSFGVSLAHEGFGEGKWEPPCGEPPATATAVVRNAYTRRVTEQQEVACLMLEKGQSVSTFVLKIKAYLDQMEQLGYPMPLVLRVNLILTSLSKDYDQFMQNYNMHDMGKTILELHVMLKLAEKSILKKAPTVLAIRQGQIQKPKSQARGKGKQKRQGKKQLGL